MITENEFEYRNLLQKMFIIEQAKQYINIKPQIEVRQKNIYDIIVSLKSSIENKKQEQKNAEEEKKWKKAEKLEAERKELERRLNDYIAEQKELGRKIALIQNAQKLNEQEIMKDLKEFETFHNISENQKLVILDQLFNPFYKGEKNDQHS